MLGRRTASHFAQPATMLTVAPAPSPRRDIGVAPHRHRRLHAHPRRAPGRYRPGAALQHGLRPLVRISIGRAISCVNPGQILSAPRAEHRAEQRRRVSCLPAHIPVPSTSSLGLAHLASLSRPCVQLTDHTSLVRSFSRRGLCGQNLVDLAGSERITNSGAAGQALKEATPTNAPKTKGD